MVLERLPRPAIIALSLGLIIGVGTLDYNHAPDLNVSVGYLVPVVISAWYVGIHSSYLIAGLSTAIAFWAQTQGQILPLQIPLIWNAAIVGMMGCILAHLIHRTKIADETEKQLSRTDSTTGAINQLFFMELLSAEFHRAERYHFPLTLAHIVLDNLKEINERLGKDAADTVLYEFIQTLSQALRANDVVARLSNHEFAVLLPQTDETQAQQVFTRIEPAIKTVLEMETISLNYGIGIASFQVMPDSVEDLLEQTQQILQQGQKNKNRLEYQVLPMSW